MPEMVLPFAITELVGGRLCATVVNVLRTQLILKRLKGSKVLRMKVEILSEK